MPPKTKKGKKRKMATVMRHFKEGKLHSGKSKRIVTDPAQAQAIGLQMSGLARKSGRK